MNNLTVERIDNMTEEELVRREMGELEIHGAMLYLYILAKDFNMSVNGENYTTMDDIDKYTFYSGKRLEICEGGLRVLDSEGKEIIIDHVFMLENGSADVLWGYASETEEPEDDELFLVRI